MFSRHLCTTLCSGGLPKTAAAAARLLSTTPRCLGRAVVYSNTGDPTSVLEVVSTLPLEAPPADAINVKILLSPINPADINVIEGVYPSKPTLTESLTREGKGSAGQPVFVGGNEAVGQVTAVGPSSAGADAAAGLQVGDWVIVTKQQSGTWVSERTIACRDVARVPNSNTLTEAAAATLTVNPPTAYNMLHDFAKLEKGDWVIQNGANSAVGQAAIQISAAEGYNTINLVRSRDDIDKLKGQLTKLGATHVLTYDELADKSVREKIKAWTGGKQIKLGLNCVGGKETTLMSRYLGQDAHLVSYGAMSKQPLSLPTSLFIFKNLTSHGFWQSRWYKTRAAEDREQLMQKLVGYISKGQLTTPDHEVLHLSAGLSDAQATAIVQGAFAKLAGGRYGKKILLKVD